MRITRRIPILFFALIFTLCLSVSSAMAQTADATANAGASAGATAIGGGNAGAQAQTGDSSASIGLTQTSTSTGSRIPPQTPIISSPSMLQNFGPTVEPWNVGVRSVLILCADHQEWTSDEAMALINEEVDSASRAVFCHSPSAKTRIFFNINGIESAEKPPADKVFVGVISIHGDEDANTFDAFGQAVIDCTKMGGTIFVISRIGGQPKVVGGGWHFGGGGVQTSVSGADGGLGSAVSGIAGIGKASSMYVGMPYVEGLAYRVKSDGAITESSPAVIKPQKKAPMGMYYDEHGNIQFEKAYGAGVINGR